MEALSHVKYMLSISTDFRTVITKLMSAVLQIKEGEDSFYVG